jgi:predicted RNA polymerase sigma factor
LEAFERTLEFPFQPLEATRAHLLSTAGRDTEAVKAYERAISLATEPAVRRWLRQKRDGLLVAL